MTQNQEFWANIKHKYEEKNRALEQREQELRLRIDAINNVLNAKNAEVSGDDAVSRNIKPLGIEPTTETVPPPEFISCVCPTSQEKGGFFKCVMSLFHNTKQTNSPPAPVSTPENKVVEDLPKNTLHETPTPHSLQKTSGVTNNYLVHKNENCLCNPCIEFEDSDSGKMHAKETNLPNKNNSFSGGSACNCSVCDLETRAPSGQSCCNCSSDSISCCCNFGASGAQTKAKQRSPCRIPCQQLEASAFHTPNQMQHPRSLQSMDLHYMKNIHDLAVQQKTMLKEINNLEQKAKIYGDVFNEYAKQSRVLPSVTPYMNTPLLENDNKENAELKFENLLLKQELKDMRLEIKQYLEKMEGPMIFKLESEKYKYHQLEKQLESIQVEAMKNQQLYQKEINGLKMELCTAKTSIYHLTSRNNQLEEDIKSTQEKCVHLEEELIRQKISEAETIKHLQAAIHDANTPVSEQNECSMHQIARELSNILKDCEPCGECVNIPEDLMGATNLLKNLMDMIDSKLDSKNERGSFDMEPTKLTVGDTPTGLSIKSKGFVPQFDKSLSYQEETIQSFNESKRIDDLALNQETVQELAESLRGSKQSDKFMIGQQESAEARKSVQEPIISDKFMTEQQESAEARKSVQESIISDKFMTEQQESAEARKSVQEPIISEPVQIVVDVEESIQISQKSASVSDRLGVDISGSIQGSKQSEPAGATLPADITESIQGSKQNEYLTLEEVAREVAESLQGSKRSDVIGESLMANTGSVQGSKQSEPVNQDLLEKNVDSSQGSRSNDTQPQQGGKIATASSKKKSYCKCVNSKDRKKMALDQNWLEGFEPAAQYKNARKKCLCDNYKNLKKDTRKRRDSDSPYPQPAEEYTQKTTLEDAGKIHADEDAEEKQTEKHVTDSGKEVEIIAPVKPAAMEKSLSDKKLEMTDDFISSPTEKFKMCHQVVASSSRDVLASAAAVKALKIPDNFPFDIDTTVDIIKKTPDGIHVGTTITNSGTLEVITEGPEGVVETTLVYTTSGNVEVVTEVFEYGRCNREKFRPIQNLPEMIDTLISSPELKITASEPSKATTVTSGVKITKPQSGPSIINPNCQCQQCPGAIAQQIEPESAVEDDLRHEMLLVQHNAVLTHDDQPDPGAPKSLSLSIHAESPNKAASESP